jgi:hypothetical protein
MLARLRRLPSFPDFKKGVYQRYESGGYPWVQTCRNKKTAPDG